MDKRRKKSVIIVNTATYTEKTHTFYDSAIRTDSSELWSTRVSTGKEEESYTAPGALSRSILWIPITKSPLGPHITLNPLYKLTSQKWQSCGSDTNLSEYMTQSLKHQEAMQNHHFEETNQSLQSCFSVFHRMLKQRTSQQSYKYLQMKGWVTQKSFKVKEINS